MQSNMHHSSTSEGPAARATKRSRPLLPDIGQSFDSSNSGSDNVLFSVTNSRSTTTRINGRGYMGRKIEVRKDGHIYVDDKRAEQEDETRYKPATITVEGNVKTLGVESGAVTVHGDTQSVCTVNGDIYIAGDAKGVCTTMSGKISISGCYEGQAPPSTMSGKITIKNKQKRRRSSHGGGGDDEKITHKRVAKTNKHKRDAERKEEKANKKSRRK